MKRTLGTFAGIVIAALTTAGCRQEPVDLHTTIFTYNNVATDCLEGKQLYFQPDFSTSYYHRTIQDQATLPVDTTDHTIIDFDVDGDPTRIELPEGSSFIYYGQAYDTLYVSSDGTIAFGDIGTGNFSVVEHFRARQISLLPVDATLGGRVSYQLASNAITISYEDVQGSTVQGEFFVAGEMAQDIAITYPKLNTTLMGIVGLSDGPLKGAPLEEISAFLSGFDQTNACFVANTSPVPIIQ